MNPIPQTGRSLLAAALLVSSALCAQAKILTLTKDIIDFNNSRVDFGVATIPTPTGSWTHSLAAGDTIQIEGHTRKQLVLLRINPPNADTNPVTITNQPGTQFIIDSTDVNFKKGLTMSGCSHFILTGTYIPDPPPATTKQPGIVIAQTPPDASGVVVTQYGGGNSGIPVVGATDFEVAHLVIGHTGFAGVFVKCDDITGSSGISMDNVRIHHLKIHDTGGEGMYIGASDFATVDRQEIHGLDIHHNEVTNSGWDGIQVGCATQGALIHHNTIDGYGLLAPNIYQDEGMRINPGTAGEIYNNKIVSRGNSATGKGTGILANPYASSLYYNNIVVDPPENGIDINTDYRMQPNTTILIYHNTITRPGGQGVHFRSASSVGNKAFSNIVAEPLPPNGAYWGTANNPQFTWDNLGNLSAPTVAGVGFLNAAALDFHLTSAATTAIDQGSSLAGSVGLIYDFSGDPDDPAPDVIRPQGAGYDVGAFEYPVTTSAPAITTQPATQTVTVGGSVTFTVAATGTAPLSYQWRRNGTAISGATSASYTIASVQTSHAGGYSVVVTNAAGSATSNSATLTVNTATGLITPAGYGQAGTAYCPAAGAFNEPPTWNAGSGVPTGVSTSPYTATGTAYANRYWYIDLGTNWANLRITGTWSRYMPLTTGSYSGFGVMWWDNDTDAVNDGISVTGLNFCTAQGLNTGSTQPWVRDTNATASPITPQGRYLIINTGLAPAARVNEFAISGYTVY